MLNVFPTAWPPRLHMALGRPVSLLVNFLVTTRRTASVSLAFWSVVARLLAPLAAVMSVAGWGYWMGPHLVANRRLALRARPFVVVSAADRARLCIPRVVRNDFDPNP